MLFSELALICQLSALVWNTEMLYFGKRKLSSILFFLLRLHAKNCFPELFYIICGSTTGRSFTPIIRRLPFAWWLSVPVENYYKKFHLTEISHLNLKPISYNITTKCYFVCSVLYKKLFYISFSRMFYLIYFGDAVRNVRKFFRRTKLISSFFKDIYVKNVLWF